MKKVSYIIVLVLSIFIFQFAWCQPGIRKTAMVEIVKISEFNRSRPNLSFNVIYKYADNASPINVLEQINGTYKLQDGKYKIILGDAMYLQGNLYNLTLFNDDSAIIVNERSVESKLFQIPVLDSLFRAALVDSIQVSQLNDTTNLLKLFFKPDSYYSGYEMHYHKNRYRIYKITYTIREFADNESNPNPSGLSRITMEFSGYSTSRIDPEEFNEDHYIYRTGSTFYARPAYSNYRLVINVGN